MSSTRSLVKRLPKELEFQEDCAAWLYPDYLDIDEGRNFPLTAVYSGENAYRGVDIPRFTDDKIKITHIGSCIVETDCSCLDGQKCCHFGSFSDSDPSAEMILKNFDACTADLRFQANTQHPLLAINIKREGTTVAHCKIYANSLERSPNDVGIDFYVGQPKTGTEIPDIGTVRESAKNQQIIQVELRLNSEQNQPTSGAQGRPAWSGITSKQLNAIVAKNEDELDDADKLIAHLHKATRIMLTAFCADEKQPALREFGAYYRSVSYAAAHLGNFWWYTMVRIKSQSLTARVFTLNQVPFPRWMVTQWKILHNKDGIPIRAIPDQMTQFGAPLSHSDVPTAAFIHELAIAREHSDLWDKTDSLKKAITSLKEGQVREDGLQIPQITLNAPAASSSPANSANWFTEAMSADSNRLTAFNGSINESGLLGNQKAFVKMLFAEEQNLALLYGPAATGKTRTLVAIAIALVKAQFRVLITAPSYGTREVIAQALLRASKLDISSWLCLRPHGGKYDSEMKSAFGSDISMEGFNTSSAENAVRLVVCTNFDSGDPVLSQNFHPDVLLMDNANQSSSLEAFIPFATFKEHIRFSIMAADLTQAFLRTTIPECSEAEDASRHSMFEKLWCDPVMGNSRSALTLRTQYRTHPELFEFSKTFIYNSEQFKDLTNDRKFRANEKIDQSVLTALRPLESRSLWRGRRHIGIDCKGSATKEENSNSYSNETEARQIVDVLRLLVKSGVKATQIFVVSPQRSQVDLIKHLLSHESCEDFCTVEVDTPTKFQGRECEITILTLVKSDTKSPGGIGMIGRADILNLAMTRAKQWVFVIGNILEWRHVNQSNDQLHTNGASRQILKELLKSMTMNREVVSSADWHDAMGTSAPLTLQKSIISSRTKVNKKAKKSKGDKNINKKKNEESKKTKKTRKNKKKKTKQPEQTKTVAVDMEPMVPMANGTTHLDAQSDDDSRPAKRQCMSEDWEQGKE